jgi:NADPH-dependent curcumin reductase CurA
MRSRTKRCAHYGPMVHDGVNHQVRLAARPVGLPKDSDWSHTDEPVPTPAEGEIVVQVTHISLDPAMRGWMNDARSYVPPVGIGEVMRAGTLGRVIASRHQRFAEGDHVAGIFGVQEYALSDGKGVQKVDTALAPLPTHLGALGMPGLTAYFGLLDVGRPEPGQTVVVSGAAGAVGMLVGQIAKIKGCRAVGIAGGPEKCAYVVDELGFDACLDYRGDDLRGALRAATPDRVDVYFDNVGGEILDLCLARLAFKGRVVLCGAISQYNAAQPAGPSNYMSLLVNRGRMEGFIVFDYARRYREGAEEMARWIGDGRLKVKEDVVRGTVADFPATLLRLFRGENLGKLILELPAARG